MNDLIMVKRGAMAGLRASLDHTVSTMQSTLDEMESQLRAQLGGEWEGRAQQAFEAARRRWTEVFTSMHHALRDHGRLVQDAQEDYDRADRTSQRYFEIS